MADQTSRTNSLILQLIVPFIIPAIIGIGTFFTLQADNQHLEERVAMNESEVIRDISSLETRLRELEVNNASRLSNIEARLVAIESYTAEITALLRQSTVSITAPSQP